MNDLQVVVVVKVIHNQNDVVAMDQAKLSLPKLDKESIEGFEKGLVGLGESQDSVKPIAMSLANHVIWLAHRELGLELNAMAQAEQEEKERLQAEEDAKKQAEEDAKKQAEEDAKNLAEPTGPELVETPAQMQESVASALQTPRDPLMQGDDPR